MNDELSHLDEHGSAKMVDISSKRPVKRTARALAKITLKPDTLQLIRGGLVKKGDVLAVARTAGICAAKRTPELIPLCHHIRIDHVGVDFRLLPDGIEIESSATCTDRTGIEMEALTAVTVAALTLYDMCKSVDDSMEIGNVVLLEKTKSAP